MRHSFLQAEPTFVGRNKEIDELLQCLASVIEGQGRTLIISGPAGSGKTRLMNHFLGALSEKVPITILTGQCISNIAVPYHPFLEALKNYLELINNKKGTPSSLANEENYSRGFANNISELIIHLRGKAILESSGSIVLTPEVLKNQTFGAIKEVFTSICKKSPVLLFFEDIQWADSATLELLNYLSRMSFQHLLVIATLDNEMRIDESMDPLRLIEQNPNFKEIKLSGLAADEVFSLASQMTENSVLCAFSQKLHTKSNGNPLFIVEFLRTLLEQDFSVIGTDKGSLLLSETPVPTELEATILPRLLKIIPEQRKILDIASAINTKFDAALLSELLEKNIAEVFDKLQRISQESSFIIREGMYYRFSHKKIRDEVYKLIPAGERKTYHTRIAEQMERSIDNSSTLQIGAIAYHFARSNNIEKGLKYSLAAGEQALSLMAFFEAVKHFNHVVDSTAKDAQYIPQREKATEELCTALLEIGNSKATEMLTQLGEQTKSPLIKVRVYRKAAQAFLQQGNLDYALKIIRIPLSYTDVDRLEIGRLLLTKGMVEARWGTTPDALEDLQRALKYFEEEQSYPDLIDALIESSLVLMQTTADNSEKDNQQQALALIIRAVELCKQTNDEDKHFIGLITSFMVFIECGLYSQATPLVKEVTNVLQKINYPTSKDSKEPWKFWVSSYLTEKTTMEKIFSKIYDRMEFDLSGKIELNNENKQDLQNAVEESLKGSLLAESRNRAGIHALLLENLIREYSLLGYLEKAEDSLHKLEKKHNPDFSSRFILEKNLNLFSKALFFTFKDQWQEANRFYIESINDISVLHPGTDIEAQYRQWYCCALLQHGQFEKAMQQLAQSKKISNMLVNKLSNANIIPSLSMQSSIQINKEFTITINLVNVGNGSAIIEEISDLLPPSFKITSTNPLLNFKECSLMVSKREVAPLKNETFVLSAKASVPGTYTLNPRVTYTDNLDQNKTVIIEPFTFTVHGPQAVQAAPLKSASPITINTLTEKNLSHSADSKSYKTFDVFLCYKKSSAKDFADHLKAGLEELGLHTFLDTKDIPLTVEGHEGWARFRDKAIEESKFFVLIMTPGFNLSSEVVKEIDMARKHSNKTFIFFRHRNMGRRIVVNFTDDSLDIGKLEQVSFESKEELLRHAVNILPCSKPT